MYPFLFIISIALKGCKEWEDIKRVLQSQFCDQCKISIINEYV